MPPPAIRPMTAADIPIGMALKQQAGWNQTEADWRRMLDLQPDGCFVAEWEGTPVGTVVSCRFGPVAWIAMMLVEADHRGRGIGRALMQRALDTLDAAGVRSVRLDATPLGRPLYESLGFRAEATILRHAGIPARLENAPPGDARLAEEWDDALLDCDRLATGTDRGAFLKRLAADNPNELRVIGSGDAVAGVLLARPGSGAWQIGPCSADEASGATLLADALARHAGEAVIVDIPEAHAASRAVAEARGLAVTRHLLRMTRGPRVAERLDRIWAGSGPEMG